MQIKFSTFSLEWYDIMFIWTEKNEINNFQLIISKDKKDQIKNKLSLQ